MPDAPPVLDVLVLLEESDSLTCSDEIPSLIKGLDKRRFRVFSATVRSHGRGAEDLQCSGANALTLGVDGYLGDLVRPAALLALVRLLRLLRSVRPAVLHTTGDRAGVLGRFAGRLSGVPVVISSGESRRPPRGFQALLARLSLGLADAWLVRNSEERRGLAARGIHARRILPSSEPAVRDGSLYRNLVAGCEPSGDDASWNTEAPEDGWIRPMPA